MYALERLGGELWITATNNGPPAHRVVRIPADKEREIHDDYEALLRRRAARDGAGGDEAFWFLAGIVQGFVMCVAGGDRG